MLWQSNVRWSQGWKEHHWSSSFCYYGLKGRDKHYFVFIHFSTNPEETGNVALVSFYAASDNMQQLRKTQKVNVHLTLACSSLNPSEDGDKLKVFLSTCWEQWTKVTTNEVVNYVQRYVHCMFWLINVLQTTWRILVQPLNILMSTICWCNLKHFYAFDWYALSALIFLSFDCKRKRSHFKFWLFVLNHHAFHFLDLSFCTNTYWFYERVSLTVRLLTFTQNGLSASVVFLSTLFCSMHCCNLFVI